MLTMLRSVDQDAKRPTGWLCHPLRLAPSVGQDDQKWVLDQASTQPQAWVDFQENPCSSDGTDWVYQNWFGSNDDDSHTLGLRVRTNAFFTLKHIISFTGGDVDAPGQRIVGPKGIWQGSAVGCR